jgi:6-phosphogluconolactonase
VIDIFADLNALSEAAARLFADQAKHASAARGRFSVALSGGSTPSRTYELLAQPPFRDRVPWPKVHVFWGDERCVPADDLRSNYRMARQALLDHVPIPPEQIHPIACAHEPRAAAERYETVLRGFFGERPPRFDLVFLGLGANGHTASLFPDTPVLEERQRWVAEVYVAEQDLFRVTLTAPLLNQAAIVAFLVAGAAKATVLHDVLQGPREPSRLPAQLIRPTDGNLHWLVDRTAARLLPHEALERTGAMCKWHHEFSIEMGEKACKSPS